METKKATVHSRRSVEVTTLAVVETQALRLPEACQHCHAPVGGYEEVGLVDEILYCDAEGDCFDSSTNERAFVTSVRCEECGETLIGQDNIDQLLVPELLAACRRVLVEDAGCSCSEGGSCAFCLASAAIAKAEGRE